MQRHPSGLYLLFITEMWERFSYYGMRALFVYFLTQALLFTDVQASNLYGDFTGLVYLTPLLGGYVSDRYWGNRRSIIVGGALMAMGQFTLFLSSTFYQTFYASPFLYIGLTLLIIGNGFFKPNISTMVGQLYPENDPRVDGAYTIFYMGINLGAFFSPLICGTLGQTNDVGDFRWGFLAASIGMIIGLFTFILTKNRFLVTPEGKPIGCKPAPIITSNTDEKTPVDWQRIVLSVVGCVVLFCMFFWWAEFDFFGSLIFSASIMVPVYIITDKSLTKIERSRILVIYVLAFMVLFFWAAYEQAGSSLSLFTQRQVDRTVMNYEFRSSHFQALNPIFIVALAPVISMIWTAMSAKHIHFSICQKQALGLLILALSFVVLAWGTNGISPATKVSIWLIVVYYLISTVGELCLSPVGLSMVNKLSPARFASLLMGVWFMSTAAADKFSGMLSALYPSYNESTGVVDVKTFCGYQINNIHDFFLVFVALTIVASVVLFAISPKLEKMMHEESVSE